jgi:predicted HicB family RNase H-like nuclease
MFMRHTPEKPFKGTFNLRLEPDLHKHLVVNATDQGLTMNDFVKGVLNLSKGISPEL